MNAMDLYEEHFPMNGGLFDIAPTDESYKICSPYSDKTPICLYEAQRILCIWSAHSKLQHYIEPEKFNTQPQSFSIYDCLMHFSNEEQLTAENTWYCNNCKEFEQAFKTINIWDTPKILPIHLKRFYYSGLEHKEKLSHLVTFPIHNLDLTPYIIGPIETPPIYDLCALMNHSGSLVAGHYTAYTKYRQDGKWYCFDDEDVREVHEVDLISEKAYVLFYVRKDVAWTAINELFMVEEDSEDSEDEDDNYNQSDNGNQYDDNNYNQSDWGTNKEEINLNQNTSCGW